MKSCTYTDQLDAYLDGDLAPEAARTVEEHVAECTACVEEFALAQRIQGVFQAIPEEPCPDDVFAAALARIESEKAVVPGSVDLPARAEHADGHSTKRHASQRTRMTRDRATRPVLPISRLRRWRVAGAVVAGLAVFVAGIVFLRPMFEAPTAGPELAEGSPQPELVTAPAPATDSSEEPASAVSPERLDTEPEANPAPGHRVDPDVNAASTPMAALPATQPETDLAEVAQEGQAAPRAPEAEKARQEALLALSIVADASRQSARAAGERVDDSFGHVSEALAVAITR